MSRRWCTRRAGGKGTTRHRTPAAQGTFGRLRRAGAVAGAASAVCDSGPRRRALPRPTPPMDAAAHSRLWSSLGSTGWPSRHTTRGRAESNRSAALCRILLSSPCCCFRRSGRECTCPPGWEMGRGRAKQRQGGVRHCEVAHTRAGLAQRAQRAGLPSRLAVPLAHRGPCCTAGRWGKQLGRCTSQPAGINQATAMGGGWALSGWHGLSWLPHQVAFGSPAHRGGLGALA